MATINEQVTQYLNETTTLLQQRPEIVVGIAALLLLAFVYKKQGAFWRDEESEKEYDPTDWDTKIPSELKQIAEKSGKPANKPIWLGDVESKGHVVMFEKQTMPENIDFMEYLFGDYNQTGDEDDGEDVYIFIARETGQVNKYLWRFVDEGMGKTRYTNIFVVKAENVKEERDRFRMDEDVQFKMVYGNIFEQKGMTTEAVTDQFPLYKARKNIVEGIEEFSMKTLFLDRKHSSQVAQMREDVDEEALKRLLGQGKNF